MGDGRTARHVTPSSTAAALTPHRVLRILSHTILPMPPMKLLHDPAVHRDIRARLASLQPDSVRRWGQMSVDQMLWHVSEALRAALGQSQLAPAEASIPKPLLRFFVLNLPWPKGAPTHPGFVAGERYDFEEQKQRCLQLVDAFVQRDIASPWPESPLFGRVGGRFMSGLQAKHLEHHLQQFSA